jgi:hypothetical protein
VCGGWDVHLSGGQLRNLRWHVLLLFRETKFEIIRKNFAAKTGQLYYPGCSIKVRLQSQTLTEFAEECPNYIMSVACSNSGMSGANDPV